MNDFCRPAQNTPRFAGMLFYLFVTFGRCWEHSLTISDMGSKLLKCFISSVGLTLFILSMYSIFMKEKNYNHMGHLTKLKYIHDFEENVGLLEWICIPPAPEGLKNICKPPTRDLLAFNAKSNITLKVYGESVKFISAPIAKQYKILHNHTAIFHNYLHVFFPSNIYHFFAQFYTPFHYLLDFSSNLNLTKHMSKTSFFCKPLGDGCIQNNFSSFFLGSLKTGDSSKYAYTHHAHPGNICFRYGLFSNHLHSKHSHESAKHLLNHYGVNQKHCPSNLIILSERKRVRKWTNIRELQKAAIAAGFNNTNIINFANISLIKQLKLSYCADVLVGPHSAALFWSNFMRPNSSVIEIVWPKFGWSYFYSTYFKRNFHVPVNFIQLETENITKLDYSIKRELKNHGLAGGNLTQEQLLKKFLRMGKHCDFSVDKNIFLNKLRKAVSLVIR